MKKNFLRAFFLILFFYLLGLMETYAQIGIRIEPPPRTVQLFEPEALGFTSFFKDSTLFKKAPPFFERIVTIDSSGKFISVTDRVAKTEFYLPAVVDLETYIVMRINFDNKQMLKQSFIRQLGKQVEKKIGALELEIPIRIKSAAFKRIFGSDRVALRVTGNISFDLSGRTEKRSGQAINATQNRGTFSPRFNQTQQFTIEGKIGDKVTVSVQQNSEATFDFENTLKLTYEGDEDEIVQRIEAGNIGLSLPSTKYVIFGGSNQGLFGLKSHLKVGNWNITAIASLEKGEQEKLTITGSATTTTEMIRDYEFIKDRYFFIDTYYRDHFESQFSDDMEWYIPEENKIITNLEVFITGRNTDSDARYGAAYSDVNLLNDMTSRTQPWTSDEIINLKDENAALGSFKRLKEGIDYNYDSDKGFFWLMQPLTTNDMLAVAYQTKDGVKTGTLTEDIVNAEGDSLAYILRLIKPKNMDTDSPVWTLMMRNVYSLRGSDIDKEGFDLSIEYNRNDEHQTNQLVKPKQSYLYLMGLDRRDENMAFVEGGDKKIDYNTHLLFLGRGILIFPTLQPFNPITEEMENDPEQNPHDLPVSKNFGGLADENRVDIYLTNTENTEKLRNETKFEIVVTSRSTKSTFNLGWNVLEGSEEVLLNGNALKRDVDYAIDYLTGQLTLLSNEAMRSSSNLEIKYEKAAIFQLDKKTILGTRAEYRFWDDSFFGFTTLYMNKSTLDQRVRIGQEPFRNFVWDINTALNFKPRFLTKAVDALPFVETNAPSTLKIEGEFAQVLPDPNTMNNESTGDKNGVAYIDDFESSKRMTTLGIRYATWTPASPLKKYYRYENFIPVDTIEVDDIATDKNRGFLTWYNPYYRVPIKEIWPNRDLTSRTEQTTEVLFLDAYRKPEQNPDSAWVGIMRSTAVFANQQKTKFLELWVKGNADTNSFRINIDIGQISEDWYLRYYNENQGIIYGGFQGRGRFGLDTEDRNNTDILDEGEDTGIDGYANGHPGDIDNLGPEYSDNWRQPNKDSRDFTGINGTEENSIARGQIYPDTEDLNGDGILDLVNSYFTYSFTLDPRDEQSQKYFKTETENKGVKTGWRLYRIPLKEFHLNADNSDTNFIRVNYVRLWLSNLDTTKRRLQIAAFDFVGNEWEEQGIASAHIDSLNYTKDDSVFKIQVYNTEENSPPYYSPPGVTGVRDRVTKAMSKEQSLVLTFNELKGDHKAVARKSLYEVLSLVNYKRLKMFVHGAEPVVGNSDSIVLSLRFGSDTKNYYEVEKEIHPGWDERNRFDIDLGQLARIKEDKYYDPERDMYETNGMRAKGKASLNTIRFIEVIVYNRGDREFTGEIWLDEMRVADARQESGTALRLKTNLALADLLTVNAEWESKDADFHDLKTQFGAGSTTETQNYSGTIKVDKLLPGGLNLSLPVDARASFDRRIPKYKPSSDILTGYQNNTIGKKIKSLFGSREVPEDLEDIISQSELYGIGMTVNTLTRSPAWYLYYTIDQLKFDFDYSYKISSDYRTQKSESEQYRETITYSIPFGRNNNFAPFKMFEKIPVLKKLSDQKLYYTPSSLNANLNISDVTTKNRLRDENKITRVPNLNSTRSITSAYRMLPSVNFNYSRTYRADGDYNRENYTNFQLLEDIITRWDFGKDTDIGQTFKMDYSPKLFDWITTNYSYSSAFKFFYQNLDKNFKQSSNTLNRSVSANFSPNKLLGTIYKPKKTRTTRGRRPPPSRTKKNEDDQEDKKDEKNEGKKSGDKKKGVQLKLPNPLTLLYNIFNNWNTISLNYQLTDNVTTPYVQKMPDWDYQFGFTKKTMQIDTSGTGLSYIPGPSRNYGRSLSTSTKYKISKNISANFSHDYSTNKTINDRTQTGNKSITYYFSGDDPTRGGKFNYNELLKDIRSFIPNWKISVSGLEKFLFFPEFARTVSLSHSRSSKYSTTLNYMEDPSADSPDGKSEKKLLPDNETFTNNYQPYIGLDINWKFGLSSQIRINKSTKFEFNQGGGSKKNVTNNFSISGTYHTSGGFKIPIPIWPFNNKTIKNEIDFTLTFDKSESVSYQQQHDQTSFQEKTKNKSWKLRPSASYRFSRRISGSIFYEKGVNETKTSGEFSYNEFGITVNIAIRD